MNEIWANRLIAGTKTWDQVPMNRRDGVTNVLIDRVESGEITQERFDEITKGSTVVDTLEDW